MTNSDMWFLARADHRLLPRDGFSDQDRRGHRRVEMGLPVYAYMEDASAPDRIGSTLNISRSGVLLRWEHASQPRLGEVIRVDVELPQAVKNSKTLMCRGKVVRIEASTEGCLLVALAIDRMDFKAPAKPVLVAGSESAGRRRGHSVVEIALLAPWIFFLFVGLVDFGFFAYAMICTQNAARTVALYTSSHDSAATDVTHACTIAIGEMQTLPNMRSLSLCCAAVSASCPLKVTATKVAVGVDGQPASQVQITYLTVPMIPIPGLLNGQFQLSRTVQARINPYN